MSSVSKLRTAGIVALLFGLLTIFSGWQVLFGDEVARTAAGAFVPFVLWFNFCAGFAYCAAGIGLLMRFQWTVWLSLAIAVATLVVFLTFGFHVFSGGPYEMRTVGAMTLRGAVWLAITMLAWKTLRKSP